MVTEASAVRVALVVAHRDRTYIWTCLYIPIVAVCMVGVLNRCGCIAVT